MFDYDAYLKVRKLGIRSYNAALSAHKDPHPPVLEEIVPELDRLTRFPLGVISIPLSKVVGTVTSGRAFAFAPNMMPLLELNTEFSTKWLLLYDSILNEGMTQPIKALEYMGSYYLIEGNKRVSVMKYLNAKVIEADVVRVIPEFSDESRTHAYKEYCDFTRDTHIFEMMMTEEGSFPRLAALCGHTWGERWPEDDALLLRSYYRYFSHAYSHIMADKEALEPGDAFLRYLIAFGYRSVITKSEDEISADIRLMSAEFIRLAQGESVSLIMDRTEASPSLISSLFRPAKKKAAFLYTRSPEDSGWNYWHELGRLSADQAMGDRLETTSRITPSRAEFEEEVEKLIADGYDVIFATSPVMLNSCIQPSLKHPDVKILCCSLLAGYHHIRSYYLRFYEAKFLLGLAAGYMAKNHKIGYIADYPIYGTAASINAFALGARMTDPQAKIYLAWSTRKDFDPDKPFGDEEIQVISNRDINAPKHASLEYGLYLKTEDGIRNIAALIPDWGVFYRAVVEQLLTGSFGGDGRTTEALNYWWGTSSGALDVVLSSWFDPFAGRLIHHFQAEMQEARFNPFEGELRDQNGAIRCTAEQHLTPAEILCMDYLLDNVIGTYPADEDLQETALPIVRLQGMSGELKPEVSTISWKKN